MSKQTINGKEYEIGPDANLWRADLWRADLTGADLRGADLTGADLTDADLRGAYLTDADLTGADLRGAYLRGAYLTRANLTGAYLRRADLTGADLTGAHLPHFQIPQEGELIVWKSTQEGLVKLRVPPAAKRTASLVGRKCRAEFVEVLEAPEGAVSRYDGDIMYVPGENVRSDKYDGDIRVECTHGIHFFLTREEAEGWL